MPLPDHKLLAFPKGGRPSGLRDARIDAFRGLALVMIFINHVPGNPYEVLTTRSIGFSDAAEAFFMMSGIAAGLAYAGRFTRAERARAGLWPAVAPVWRRVWTLYLTQIFLTVMAIALFVFGAALFADPALLKMHNLGGFFSEPESALFGLPLLGHQVGYVNILPTYIVILLALPALLPLAVTLPWAAIGVAAALWLATGHWRLHMPTFPLDGVWQLNPFAWQLVFVVGLAIGIALRDGRRLVARSRLLFWGLVAFLLFVMVWMHVPELAKVLNHQLWRLGEAGVPFNMVSQDKVYLGLPRLLHILALVYVVSCLPWVTRACGWQVAAPLRLMGRHGLLVFAAGTLMALSLQIVLKEMTGWPALAWTLPPVGLVVLVGIAALAEASRQRLAPRKAAEAAPPPAPALSLPEPARRPVRG